MTHGASNHHHISIHHALISSALSMSLVRTDAQALLVLEGQFQQATAHKTQADRELALIQNEYATLANCIAPISWLPAEVLGDIFVLTQRAEKMEYYGSRVNRWAPELTLSQVG